MGKSLIQKIIVSLILVIVIGIGFWMYFSDEDSTSYDTTIAKTETLVQEINVTGRVEAAQDIDLAFQNSGRVVRVLVAVGDEVSVGERLLVLDTSEEEAQRAQAEAKLLQDEARLSELLQGIRQEEIEVQEVKVSNTEIALTDARRTLVDQINEAYIVSDDAIRNRVDQFFNNPRTPNPETTFLAESQVENDLENGRVALENLLLDWDNSLNALSLDSNIDFYVNEAQVNLNTVKDFLNKSSLAVNGLEPTNNISQITIDSWRSDVSTGRTNVNTTISELTSADEAVRTAISNLALANQELELKKSGTIDEQIKAQEAKVAESQATIDFYDAQIRKATMRSPINGIITIQDAKIGSIVPANEILVSIISQGEHQIEAFVVEADIANLNVGDVGELTLDAYGDDAVFQAEVVAIDPAAQLLEGVASYKTTLQFTNFDERVRVGMTADIDIVTAQKENVIAVPQRAVIFREGDDKVVRVIKNGALEERMVQTGLNGNRGKIEIISGVSLGEEIVISINN